MSTLYFVSLVLALIMLPKAIAMYSSGVDLAPVAPPLSHFKVTYGGILKSILISLIPFINFMGIVFSIMVYGIYITEKLKQSNWYHKEVFKSK